MLFDTKQMDVVGMGLMTQNELDQILTISSNTLNKTLKRTIERKVREQ